MRRSARAYRRRRPSSFYLSPQRMGSVNGGKEKRLTSSIVDRATRISRPASRRRLLSDRHMCHRPPASPTRASRHPPMTRQRSRYVCRGRRYCRTGTTARRTRTRFSQNDFHSSDSHTRKSALDNPLIFYRRGSSKNGGLQRGTQRFLEKNSLGPSFFSSIQYRLCGEYL
jgi:hypothetical protein